MINNQSFWVIENSVNGTIVDTISANDPDAEQTLSFAIISGNSGSAFSIDPISGILSVNNSAALVFQTNPIFYLNVRVTDNGMGNLFDEALITVDITPLPNQAPEIMNQTFSINENEPFGTFVGTVVASDPNAGQVLTFSILSGNTDNAFSINATTGDLTVANAASINFELIASFALVVKVQDDGFGNLSNQATITVILLDVNESPVANDQIFSISEMTPNGTQVGIVSATDPDAGQILFFSITSGNTDNAFLINPANGSLSVNNSVALNFQTNPIFNLSIRVTDNGTGNLYNDAAVIVNVLQNSNQPPLINNQVFRIDENLPDSTFVGNLYATDPNIGQTLTYSIVSGNTDGAFDLNPLTGELIVSDYTVLNYEVINIFNLVVQVQDNGLGNLSSFASIVITLLDVNEPPVANNETFNVFESTAYGTFVGLVTATDPDQGQMVTFAIDSGNTDNAFAIDPENGSITVNNPNALIFLTNPNFNLIIRATDDGEINMFDSATISIIVLQNPNQPPVISDQTFQVNENSSTGTIVGTVVAMDPDINQNLAFTIISGNANNTFSINALSGIITVENSAALNFEITPTYQLLISVKDDGSGNLTSNAIISINLNDTNEPPMMADQTFSLKENSATGTLVGKLIASDPDMGQNLSYSITAGNTGNTFSLNANTGVLSVANPALLVYATNPTFILQITVQDNGQGTLSNSAFVTVNLIQNTDYFVYIDPSQPNNQAENGSLEHPYNSWTDVTFLDGYTYFQKRGTTYTGTSNITIYAKNAITIDAYSIGSLPVIQNNSTNAKIIDFTSSKNCTIRNIELKSAGNALCCIYISGNLSSEIRIENCNLHDAQYGIRSILKGIGLHIVNSTISKIGLDGIYAANFQSIEIGNCNIYDVNFKWFQNPSALEATGDCIELNSTSGTVNIHHNTLSHSSTGNMAALSISGGSYSGLIEGNTIVGNRLAGNECLRLNSSNKTIVVRYNTISDGLCGINTNISTSTIYYNQFNNNTVAIKIQKNKPADIKNNTFFGNFNYSIESLSGSSVTSRNNIFYLDALSAKVYKFGGSNMSNYNTFNIEKSGFLNGYSTLSSWVTATNQDKNSILADPLFLNITNKDLRLQEGSPCINRGINLNLPQDFFGTSVPQGGVPDIGFHEIVIPVKEQVILKTNFQDSNNDATSATIYP
ncbi:MAG: cadherin repeat domain-containing protein, partial [Bacteroidota bacterium]